MKKKLLYRLILYCATVFFVIQFFQPKKNNSFDSENSITETEQLPDSIQSILKNACMNCHSNQTHYFWYDRIAPASWYVNSHIKDGKKKLNFSEWGNLKPLDKISLLNKIIDETKDRHMPLKSYKLMHKPARLTDDQVKMLDDWAESLGMQIYKNR